MSATPESPRRERVNPPPAESAKWFLSQPAAFHDGWMAEALAEARLARDAGEVPMGCVVVRRLGEEAVRVAAAHNLVEALHDPTAHAEALAIRAASVAVGDWRLTDCALYCTKEPCPMCGGAAVLGRLALVAWGVSDPKRGAATVFGLFGHPGLNHHPATTSGVGGAAALTEIQAFFRSLRSGSSKG